MLPLLLFLLSLQSINQLGAASASEGYLKKVKEGLDEETITAVNGTTEDYYEDNYSDQTNYDWLNEFIEEKDKCDPNPCYNNGVCENDGDGDFKCICPRPYKGRRCQLVINVCRGVRCGRGECVFIDKEPFYECKCMAPFQPPLCRRPSACNPSPCLNGGTCIKGPTRAKFYCKCPENYRGKFCQVGPDDCYEGDGASYRGFVSETVSGYECLPWNSHVVASLADADFDAEFNNEEQGGEEEEDMAIEEKEEKNDGLGQHNYCRNPDGEEKPWCFYRYNNTLTWDDCNVTRCYNDSVIVEPTANTEPIISTPAPREEFSVCGKLWPSRITPRIFGGKKSKPGANPWQVSLQTRRRNSTQPFKHDCGGIILNSCFILTAAHCIKKVVEMQVVMGGVDLEKDEISDQTLAVESYIMHENYTEIDDVQYNDIALLKLKPVTKDGRCATETKYVKSACLPPSPFPDGMECTISGFGVTEKDEHGSSQLLETKVLLINQDRCMAPNVLGNLLDDSMLCAGRMQGEIDACQGDSGGPLICKQNGTHYIYGVVSWGDGCGMKNKPGVYVRVTKFFDWINEKLLSR